ncbi:MAG TPA: hypothetical protein VFX67_00635 [Burkholderiales bacterium]|nr:hypothetical protein [Burkholderiales bacterium]
MDAKQVRQQLASIEQAIQRASQACQNDQSTPEDLKESVRELNEQSRQAHEFLQTEDDQEAIRQCIDDLEETGDRAREACESAGNVSGPLRDAVLTAHQQISRLKHQLH